MRIKIPMTGTVIDFDPELAKLDGIGVSGDPTDPVRPVQVDLGNVKWKLINIDLENDLMEIEIEAPENIPVPSFDEHGTPILDGKGKQLTVLRPATAEEKQALLDSAQHIIESNTVDDLYAQTQDARLGKSEDVMVKYRQFQLSLKKES
jgi:hypothetical protein